jgi:hypothetical protein
VPSGRRGTSCTSIRATLSGVTTLSDVQKITYTIVYKNAKGDVLPAPTGAPVVSVASGYIAAAVDPAGTVTITGKSAGTDTLSVLAAGQTVTDTVTVTVDPTIATVTLVPGAPVHQ